MPRPHTVLLRTLLLTAALLGSVAASQAQATEWVLSVQDQVAGEPTGSTPDSVSLDYVGWTGPPIGSKVSVTVRRGGVPIAQSSESTLFARVAFAELKPGDQIVATQTPGNVQLASHTWDGVPSFDGGLCAASSEIAGRVPAGATYLSLDTWQWRLQTTNKYGSPYTHWVKSYLPGTTPTRLTPTTFRATYANQLPAGAVLGLTASVELNADVELRFDVQGAVANCVPSAADTTQPTGTVRSPSSSALAALSAVDLRKKGIKLNVTPSEPATITASLSAIRKRGQTPRLVASVSKPAAAGAATSVTLKLSKAQLRKIKELPRTARLVLQVDLKDAAGNTRTVRRTQFKVPRS